MSYYEDEIPKELKVGEKYTGRQLLIYSLNNSNVYLFSKSCQRFAEWDENNYKISSILDGYLHYSDVSQATYHIPNAVSTIYIIE